MTPPPELIAKLLNDAPFRSNQIHERDRWLIEQAYKAGYRQAREDARRLEARELSAFNLLPTENN